MAEFKVVISDPKSGKSAQKEIKEEQARNLVGLKIGNSFKGEILDLTGYEFEITGGSDYCGFPMRKDVEGTVRKQILAVKGVGVKNKKKARGKDVKYMRTMRGMRQRKTVAGNTITERTSQINVKILKHGKAEIFAAKKEEKPNEGAEKPEEKKAPEKKAEKPEAKPKEEKKEKPKEEKPKKEVPKEEKKEEPKKEKKPAEEKKEKPKTEKK